MRKDPRESVIQAGIVKGVLYVYDTVSPETKAKLVEVLEWQGPVEDRSDFGALPGPFDAVLILADTNLVVYPVSAKPNGWTWRQLAECLLATKLLMCKSSEEIKVYSINES